MCDCGQGTPTRKKPNGEHKYATAKNGCAYYKPGELVQAHSPEAGKLIDAIAVEAKRAASKFTGRTEIIKNPTTGYESCNYDIESIRIACQLTREALEQLEMALYEEEQQDESMPFMDGVDPFNSYAVGLAPEKVDGEPRSIFEGNAAEGGLGGDSNLPWDDNTTFPPRGFFD